MNFDWEYFGEDDTSFFTQPYKNASYVPKPLWKVSQISVLSYDSTIHIGQYYENREGEGRVIIEAVHVDKLIKALQKQKKHIDKKELNKANKQPRKVATKRYPEHRCCFGVSGYRQ